MTMQVAQEILAQLGGRRFIMMTGAKDFVGGNNMLTFRLTTKTKNGTKAIRITLNGSDLYDVEFLKIRKFEVSVISRHEDIYNDMLVELFERETGLLTSL